MPDTRISWRDTPPDAPAYVALRAACGLGPRTVEAAEIALPNGLHSMSLWSGDTLVGMGRIVGDGGSFVQVVDVAVHPDWQGQGMGEQIVSRLTDWIEANLPDCCHVSLVSSERATSLYARHGFRPARGMDRYAERA